MAIIRKTVSGLKPDSNYLFAVKPKNTEISASDEIPDSIRIKTPSSTSIPSTITSLQVQSNFESVMFIFQPVTDQDFSEYEYEIYDGATTSSNLVSTGRKRSTVFVVSVANSTRTVNATTGVETIVNTKYYGRVRAINTSGNAGAWTSLVTHSGNTPLITDQYIGSLTAGKITSGLITAEQIILKNPSGTLESYTPAPGMSVIRSSNFVEGSIPVDQGGTGQGWIIKGDGSAQFDAASIRGTLSANSIFINAYNRWARNAANNASNLQFVVGDINNQLYWDPTGGTPVGGVATSLLKVGNDTNFIKVDNGNLTVTGAITTNASISSSTAGGLTIGTNSLQFGAGGYKSSVMFVGWNTADSVSANKFSLGSKLYFDGTNLTVDGTINAVGGTFSGSITATGTITGGTISGATISGGNININSGLFKVDTSGNVFANNIYATGSSSDFGLQIRADGGSATSGAIWILSATNKETKLGNTLGSINVRYRAASGSIPEAVVLEPAYFTGSIWSQNRNFEINVASGYKFLVNSDIILRGSALDGFANDFATGDMNVDGGGQDGRVVQLDVGLGVTSWVVSRSGSSIKYKENITPVDTNAALNLIKKLELKKFTYKRNNKYDTDISYELKQLNYEYGFIAEEVAVSAKELAVYSFTKSGIEKKWQNFEYEDLNNEEYVQPDNWKRQSVIALLVGAVQNLNERIEFLESQLAVQ